ncbi:hypothetical protein [Leucobacter chironomi]|uniref:hypothetical protein n=1 Tax=Leucobacter chironomi TaxID=491918 RepID=UPI000424DC5D|nr:hypothetical protein [Leucobacter chironomi]
MPSSPADHPRSRVAWRALGALLAAETALLLWVLGVTIVGAFAPGGDPLQNLSLIVTAALAFAWVAVTLVGAVKAQASWVRGSSLTIHVLLFAAGTGCLQIGIGPWWLGFALVALALAGFTASILARPAAQPSGEPAEER